MRNHSARRARALVVSATAIAALAVAPAAFGHASLSPAVAKSKTLQYFTLAVPTEKENAKTTAVELTPPAGFAIDSFAPAPGWKRLVSSSGSGENAVIQKVTWTGGAVPTGEDAFFQFLAQTDASRTYTFKVRQSYSDGSVVDWTGSEGSDTPAPRVESLSSLGGGGSSTLAIAALVVGAVGLLVGGIALAGGRRALA